jgi:putative endonuclease
MAQSQPSQQLRGMPSTIERGTEAEEIVAARLRAQGFSILAQNARVGRLEIDLIARRGPLLVFCEVRSRATADFVDPILTIDHAKVSRIRNAARSWLAIRQRLRYDEVRFDAASVVLRPDTEVTYYEGAF